MKGKPRSILPLLGIGKTNNGDYVTKPHAPIHHQATWPIFLTPIKILQELRGQVTNRPWDFFLFFGRMILDNAWSHSTRDRTYLRMYIPLHSTSQSGVEQILSSTTKMVPLHLCMYLRTNVHYTPLAYLPTYKHTFHSIPHHRVEWNKKRVRIHTKIRMLKKHTHTRRWKSRMLKILPDAEKARRWKNCQMLKKHQIYSP